MFDYGTNRLAIVQRDFVTGDAVAVNSGITCTSQKITMAGDVLISDAATISYRSITSNFDVVHAAKVEAESLVEAAVRGLHRLDSSFWAEDDVFGRMSVTIEVHEEPTTHTVKIDKLKQWINSQGRRAGEKGIEKAGILAARMKATGREKHGCRRGFRGRRARWHRAARFGFGRKTRPSRMLNRHTRLGDSVESNQFIPVRRQCDRPACLPRGCSHQDADGSRGLNASGSPRASADPIEALRSV